MTGILVTSTARDQIAALDDGAAQAVDAAIQTIDRRTGEVIDLPGAPAGTSYLALSTRISQDDREGPVIIYRPRLPSEGGGWLVMSLLSPEKYQAVRRAEAVVAAEPSYRRSSALSWEERSALRRRFPEPRPQRAERCRQLSRTRQITHDNPSPRMRQRAAFSEERLPQD